MTKRARAFEPAQVRVCCSGMRTIAAHQADPASIDEMQAFWESFAAYPDNVDKAFEAASAVRGQRFDRLTGKKRKGGRS